MTALTLNYRMSLVDYGATGWNAAVNNNFAIIDALINGLFSGYSIQGAWLNGTQYTAGVSVVDTITGFIWTNNITHTSSASPTTFAADRATYPTYWVNVTATARVSKAGDTMTGPLLVTGTPTSQSNFAGQNQNNNLNINSVPVSNTTPEGGFLVSLTSTTGATSGNGPISAYKIGGAIQVTGSAGSGNIYGLNTVTTMNAGMGAFSGSGIEINTNNYNIDYAIGGTGGIVSYALNILSASTLPMTAAISVGTISTTNYAYHVGLFFSTTFGAKEYSIYDISNSQYSFVDNGTHSAASIKISATTPFALISTGVYSNAAIQEQGTAPNGLALLGTYTGSALTIQPNLAATPANSILDLGRANYSYVDNGTHASASIKIAATTPLGYFSTGTYSTAAIQEAGTAPYGLALLGSYSTAALYINPTSGTTAIGMPANKKVCFNGTDAYFYFNAGKLYFGTTVGGNVFSLDVVSGNAVFKGTVTASGVP